MLKAFDYMYETVKVVAKQLGGDIQDETRSVITRQSLEHMRQQIRELERRLTCPPELTRMDDLTCRGSRGRFREQLYSAGQWRTSSSTPQSSPTLITMQAMRRLEALEASIPAS